MTSEMAVLKKEDGSINGLLSQQDEVDEGEPEPPGVSSCDIYENIVEAPVEKDKSDATVNESAVTEKSANEDSNPSQPGTHFSLLDPKNMNVVKLKEELTLRGLSTKGLKSQLTSRLIKCLKDEECRQKLAIKTEVMDTVEESEENPPPVGEMVIKTEPVEAEEFDENSTEVNSAEASKDGATVNDKMEEGELPDDSEVDAATLNKVSSRTTKSDFGDDFPIIKPDMTDDYKKMWERRYTLPKNPRLLIYPSSKAKSGSFDCLTMSLALLRDYRMSDKKEDSFEVSLFSEFFYEMLQRDFGFRIYREIIAQNNKLALEASKDHAGDQESKECTIVMEKVNDKPSDSESTSKRRKASTATGTTNAPKQKTVDCQLLQSFVFYDQTQSDYIIDTDLEDICFAIGVGLNRAQIHRAIHKVCTKGNLFYRKWTDKPIEDTSESNSSTNETTSGELSVEVENIRQTALGNKSLLPLFVYEMTSSSHQEASSLVNGSVNENGNVNNETAPAALDGCTADVKKLKGQLEKSEKERIAMDANFNVAKNTLNDAKNQVVELKKANDILKDELSKTKEMLRKFENTEKSNKDELETFRRATERFYERVEDYIRPSSSKEKESKEKNSKSKEKDTEHNMETNNEK